MPVGPLEVIDETSLSLSVHVMEQTRADLEAEGKPLHADARRAAGRAHGEGVQPPRPRGGRRLLRLPEEGAKKYLWPELKDLFEKPGVAAGTSQELKDRLLYRQAIETARCLEENVLTTVHDANIGSIFGIGFPGLDRRRDAVHLWHGHGRVLRTRGRTGGQVSARASP